MKKLERRSSRSRAVTPAVRRAHLKALGALALAAALPARAADAYPSKTVRLVIPFAAGSATDSAGRLVAQELSTRLGQQVIVDNRAGAFGQIAAELVARSAPDGYTVFMTTNTTHSANPHLFRQLNYDPVKDFEPIARLGLLPFMVVATNDLPVKNIQEFVAYARANPGRVNVGIAGSGSSQHFAAALFEHQAQVQFTHIVYRGGAPAMTDLVAGRVDIVFSPIVETVQQVRAGQVKALGISRPQRSPEFPDVPAIAEVVPGYQFASWLGAFAPAGTPPAAVLRISRALAAGLRDPQIRERVVSLGYEPVGSTPEEFATFFAAEMPRVAELVRLSGARVE